MSRIVFWVRMSAALLVGGIHGALPQAAAAQSFPARA